MQIRALGSLFLAAAVAWTTGTIARAQCADWQPGFGAPGGNGLTTSPNGGPNVGASVVHDDGSGPALYVGGRITAAGGTTVRNIARWDGTAWSAVGTGANDEVFALYSYDDGSGPALYAGGKFTEIGGVTTRGIARWDGSSWSAVGGGLGNGRVNAFAAYDDGTGLALYAGGEFQSVGGVTARGIARWDGSAWSSAGSSSEQMYAATLAVHDDGTGPALYAAGFLRMWEGFYIYTSVVRWSGTSWTNVGGPFGGGLYVQLTDLISHDDGSGSKLYLGGYFDYASDAPGVQTLARWNGTAWEGVGPGLSSSVTYCEAFAVFDEGRGRGPELFLGASGNANDPGILRWNGTSYESLSGGLDGPYSSSSAAVYALQSYDAGLGAGRQLFALGSITSAVTSTGPTPSTSIAVWSSCDETGRTLCYGDASGTACPCGNASAVGDREGCLNSTGFGGRLRASGNPSLANDTLALDGSRMTNGSALYFQGTASVGSGSGTVFGDGLRCAGGSVRRLVITPNSAGASTCPGVGNPPLATIGAVTQPGTRVYQVWYRNAGAFCTASTFNLTNAVEIVWTN